MIFVIHIWISVLIIYIPIHSTSQITEKYSIVLFYLKAHHNWSNQSEALAVVHILGYYPKDLTSFLRDEEKSRSKDIIAIVAKAEHLLIIWPPISSLIHQHGNLKIIDFTRIQIIQTKPMYQRYIHHNSEHHLKVWTEAVDKLKLMAVRHAN